MTKKLPELSADSRALLEAGRAPDAIPAEIKARVWGQISGALLATSSPPLPRSPRLAPDAPSTVGGGKTLLALKLACATLGLAGAVAAVMLAGRRPHPGRPARPELETPAAPLRAIPPAGPPIPTLEAPSRNQLSEATRRPKPVTVIHAHPAKVPPATILPSPADQDLAAERSLIVQARSALQRGAPLDALVALRAHGEHFPAGSLAEERDALRVEALQASGDRAAAEAAAAQFARTYPHGLMGPAVRGALRGQP
jgi:hypothetical protein